MVSRLYIRRLETEVTEMRNRLEVGKANLPEQLPEFQEVVAVLSRGF
jgi:hypothetical protein